MKDELGRAVYRGIERMLDFRYRANTVEKDLWLEDSEWVSTRGAIRRLGVTHQDVFVDFGSGKGRVVLIAMRFPFRRIIGVELSETSNVIARRNVARNLRRSRCPDVQIVGADATTYEVPDDITVAYFCDPFGGEAFQGVLDRLIESHDRAPRPVRIVYYYPKEHARILATGRAQVLGVRSGRWPPKSTARKDVIVTYRITPSRR